VVWGLENYQLVIKLQSTEDREKKNSTLVDLKKKKKVFSSHRRAFEKRKTETPGVNTMKTPGRRAPTEKWHPACNRISTSMIYIHIFIDRFIAKAYFCNFLFFSVFLT